MVNSFVDDMDFGSSTYDIDNFNENVRLKPDVYLHFSLQQLSRVFEGDVTDVVGFKKYFHLVGHMEVIARASKLLPKNYDEEVAKIKKSSKELNLSLVETDAFVARGRLGLIVGEVFSNAPARGALQLFDNVDGSTSRQMETHRKQLNK